MANWLQVKEKERKEKVILKKERLNQPCMSALAKKKIKESESTTLAT